MANLRGKAIFISGGSRGIGLAIAKRAAEDGANIIIAAKTAEYKSYIYNNCALPKQMCIIIFILSALNEHHRFDICMLLKHNARLNHPLETDNDHQKK